MFRLFDKTKNFDYKQVKDIQLAPIPEEANENLTPAQKDKFDKKQNHETSNLPKPYFGK